MTDKVYPWHLLDPGQPRSSEELANERFGKCEGCSYLTKNTHQCKKCGCFMKLKVMLQNASCPIGKW